MSLVVNTNVGSLNAQRSLAASGAELKTAMERLSSGKKINSAADDAAGFAIAERMTAQVRGLNMAAKNASDGLVMVAVIQNATNDVTEILQRIRELAVQAANGTNSQTDRDNLQLEVSELVKEIDRVATQTMYNSQKVLDGSFLNKQLQVGTEGQERIAISIDSVAANSLGAYTYDTPGIAAVTPAMSVPANPIAAGTLTVMSNGAAKAISIADDSSAFSNAALINAETGETGVSAEARTYAKLTFDATTNYAIKINGTAVGSFAAAPASVSDAVAKINAVSGTTEVTATAAADGLSVMLFNSQGKDITIENTNTNATEDIDVTAIEFDGSTATGASVLLDAGANDATRVVGNIKLSSSDTFSVSVATTALFTAGSASLSAVSNVNLSTQSGSDSAISVIDDAIEKVSSMRAKLGAIENRLGYVVSNLMNVAEFTTSARSRIEDADFAVESARLARAQVLQQTATAMLAQANAQPQLALSLIR